MLPNPRLFRSRWAALLWAGGVLWFAYDVAGSAPAGNGAATDATATSANAADVAAVANLLAP
ncbi:hypothetical protein SAQ01S_20410 [Sphingomonas aquatilis NBRC 16722]|uniref:Uncharacterized protein n=1 Tax=Sphingomonas aquatilis TaxID=93063 RepID=A0AAW3TRY8_9SPHN|nr:hypothetical protein [Sphingomonas aquatilis]MBB3875835.1 hypothetical protein [Sphingomonas aquatilis]GEM72275.1 hypothetical protein SAQ01S_20410 [Sphingomonas aquatilis NBRC 16722]